MPQTVTTLETEDENPPTTMLFRLIYASRASRSLGPADVKALLQRSRDNNERLGVSGALILHDGQFVQLLEGAPSAVCKLYSRILADPLHEQAVLLDFSEIERRHFGEWAMGFLAAIKGNREAFQQHAGVAIGQPLAIDAVRARHLFDLIHDNVSWLS